MLHQSSTSTEGGGGGGPWGKCAQGRAPLSSCTFAGCCKGGWVSLRTPSFTAQSWPSCACGGRPEEDVCAWTQAPKHKSGKQKVRESGGCEGGGGREQGQRVAQRQSRGYLAGRSRPARSAYRRLSVESRTSRARCWRYVSQFAPSLARAGVPPDRSWRRRALEMLVRATCRPSAQMRSSLTHCPARRRSHCAFRAVAAATDVLRASLTDNEPHNTVLAGQGRPNSTSPSPAGPGGWGWE